MLVLREKLYGHVAVLDCEHPHLLCEQGEPADPSFSRLAALDLMLDEEADCPVCGLRLIVYADPAKKKYHLDVIPF